MLFYPERIREGRRLWREGNVFVALNNEFQQIETWVKLAQSMGETEGR